MFHTNILYSIVKCIANLSIRNHYDSLKFLLIFKNLSKKLKHVITVMHTSSTLNLNLKNTKCYLKTPLHLSAFDNNIVMAKFILSYDNVFVDALDIHDDAPLHVAASYGYIHFVKILLDAGADINILDRVGNTALHYAAENFDTKMINLLIQKGADITIRNNNGMTFREVAVQLLRLCCF